ncbi:hypothetical protein LOTGIDRAFT_191399 [Lottia gigantea]|uniref:Sulfotransferase domain-containing protein n=1 Tax=Lottia gigantea TaxID=225164 RepID=V4A9E7_LOTGI|nr:hypothetical protein LOTGIDRAFT_191399 [Lottia gigantea]ESO91705.1 hypothetical protein LOTGIDRAFT_191399 [Lottia gigantea]
MGYSHQDQQYTAPWPFLADQAKLCEKFTFNDNDVILTAYAKSGTHWLWEVLSMLIKGEAEPSKSAKERLMFSFGTQKDFDKYQSPRIFNTHVRYKGLPKCLKSESNVKTKMVYLLRNPKDVAVSYYYHLKSATDFDYNGTWNGFYSLFIEGKVPGGSWFDYVVEWDKEINSGKHPNIIVMYYEDLQKNFTSEIKRLSDFLGFSYSNDLFTAIAEKCSFSSMKENDERLKEQFPIHMSKDGKNFIYRKGVVGDWKNHFTVAQNDEMDQIITNRLKDTDLKFQYSV